MRRFISILSFFLCCSAGFFAQAPVYLMFDWNCVDYLEYRTASGNRVIGYNFRPSGDEQYMFLAGADYITSASLPAGVVSCRDFVLGETIVDAVNRRSRQVYMVQPASNGGYTLTPLVSATQVKRNGTIYKFYTTDCSFAFDTTNLRYNQNLTFAGDTYVYFSGYRLRECRLQYALEREPGRANPIRSDLEFIPGIGMISDRSGTTHAEMEARALRLVKINEQLLDDFLAATCQNKPLMRNTLSRWSGAILPEPARETYPTNTIEPRPETYSTPGGNPTPTYNNNPCPEPFQQGYHIVQRGETLNGIARAYGVDVKALIAVNNISKANKLEVCQKLKLPSTKGAPAVVPQGNNATAQPQNNSYGSQDLTPYPYNYTPQRTPAATTPAQYNFSNNTTPAVVQPGNSASTDYVHIVQPGEYLYQIARSHGLTETQIRKYNGFPPIGTVTLYPGNQIWLVDPNQIYRNNPQPSAQPQGSTDPQRPSEYNYNNTQDTRRYVFEETPADGSSYVRQQDEKAVESAQQAVQPLDPNRPYQYGYNQPLPSNTRKPTHYQEYVVLSGDTMGAVASQNRITVAELAAANEKNPNEALIPGQRLLIPKFAPATRQ